MEKNADVSGVFFTATLRYIIPRERIFMAHRLLLTFSLT